MQRLTPLRGWTDQRLSRRRFLYATAAASGGTAAVLAACAGNAQRTGSSAQNTTGSTGAIKRGGTATVLLGTAPPSEKLETQSTRSNSGAAQPLFALTYNGLVRLKVGGQTSFTDGTLDGALASKWETPDDSTFVFHLRPGVKFHDKPPVNGRELTSADVKFTFDRFVGSPFAYGNFYTNIGSVETPDAQTATFKMKAPDAALLRHLSMGFAWIIAKEAGKPDPQGVGGLDYHDPSTAIGTGPFMLDQYSDQKQTFVRNPAYWDAGLPYLDGVNYLVVPDTSSEIAALQSGQVQIGTIPLGSEQEFEATNPKLSFHKEYSVSGWYGGMRIDQPPFNDIRVRRAFAMAWDQDAIKQVYGIPTSTPSSYGSLQGVAGDGYVPLDQLGDSAQWWKLNLTQAKQLLAAAGYPNGFETSWNDSNCCNTSTLPDQVAAIFTKIGVKVNIAIKDHPAYQATTARGNFTGMGTNQVPVYDPDDFFSPVLLPGGARNSAHANDPFINTMTAQERSELDPEKRLDIIHQMVKYLAGQVYQLVYPESFATSAVQPYVKNYTSRIGYQQSLAVTWLDK